MAQVDDRVAKSSKTTRWRGEHLPSMGFCPSWVESGRPIIGNGPLPWEQSRPTPSRGASEREEQVTRPIRKRCAGAVMRSEFMSG